MKGIILLSHGPLAQGMYETTKWLMGEDIGQFDYICLEQNEDMEEFDARVRKKIEELDTGEGVVLLADVLAGTPCNRCSKMISESVELITGMNLALVMELIGCRFTEDYDFEALIQSGKDNICDINQLAAE